MHATTLRLLRLVLALSAGAAALTAQQTAPPPLVTSQEILDGLTPDGSRWLTFGGDYNNQRHRLRLRTSIASSRSGRSRRAHSVISRRPRSSATTSCT